MATAAGGQPALGVQLDQGAVAERLDLLGPAQPHPLLCLLAVAGGELPRVEGHKHRIRRRGRRRASALAGSGDGVLADGFRVAAGMPRPWRWKALRSDDQVVPRSAAPALTLPGCSASA